MYKYLIPIFLTVTIFASNSVIIKPDIIQGQYSKDIFGFFVSWGDYASAAPESLRDEDSTYSPGSVETFQKCGVSLIREYPHCGLLDSPYPTLGPQDTLVRDSLSENLFEDPGILGHTWYRNYAKTMRFHDSVGAHICFTYEWDPQIFEDIDSSDFQTTVEGYHYYEEEVNTFIKHFVNYMHYFFGDTGSSNENEAKWAKLRAFDGCPSPEISKRVIKYFSLYNDGINGFWGHHTDLIDFPRTPGWPDTSLITEDPRLNPCTWNYQRKSNTYLRIFRMMKDSLYKYYPDTDLEMSPQFLQFSYSDYPFTNTDSLDPNCRYNAPCHINAQNLANMLDEKVRTAPHKYYVEHIGGNHAHYWKQINYLDSNIVHGEVHKTFQFTDPRKCGCNKYLDDGYHNYEEMSLYRDITAFKIGKSDEIPWNEAGFYPYSMNFKYSYLLDSLGNTDREIPFGLTEWRIWNQWDGNQCGIHFNKTLYNALGCAEVLRTFARNNDDSDAQPKVKFAAYQELGYIKEGFKEGFEPQEDLSDPWFVPVFDSSYSMYYLLDSCVYVDSFALIAPEEMIVRDTVLDDDSIVVDVLFQNYVDSGTIVINYFRDDIRYTEIVDSVFYSEVYHNYHGYSFLQEPIGVAPSSCIIPDSTYFYGPSWCPGNQVWKEGEGIQYHSLAYVYMMYNRFFGPYLNRFDNSGINNWSFLDTMSPAGHTKDLEVISVNPATYNDGKLSIMLINRDFDSLQTLEVFLDSENKYDSLKFYTLTGREEEWREHLNETFPPKDTLGSGLDSNWVNSAMISNSRSQFWACDTFAEYVYIDSSMTASSPTKIYTISSTDTSFSYDSSFVLNDTFFIELPKHSFTAVQLFPSKDTFTCVLDSGWNLISVPVYTGNTKFKDFFDADSFLWLDTVYYSHYEETEDHMGLEWVTDTIIDTTEAIMRFDPYTRRHDEPDWDGDPLTPYNYQYAVYSDSTNKPGLGFWVYSDEVDSVDFIGVPIKSFALPVKGNAINNTGSIMANNVQLADNYEPEGKIWGMWVFIITAIPVMSPVVL